MKAKYLFIFLVASIVSAIIILFLTNQYSNSQKMAISTGIIWNEKIRIASGDAHRGPWRMNESDFRYVDDSTVDINDEGVIGIAWVDQSRKDIFFQAYEPDGKPKFKEPINISRSPAIFSWLPRIVISNGNADEIYILWQEIVFSGGTHGGEIFFARSHDGGKTFSEPINLSNTIAGDGKGRITTRYWHNGSLDIIMDTKGNIYVAWTEYEGKLWFSRSTDRGQRFSEPLHIAGNNNLPARGPSLATCNNDIVYLVWTVGEDPAANIHFAKSVNSGNTFDKPMSLFESNGHADAPKIAVDSNGTVHIVYAESPAGPFQQYHIHYSRSFDKGNTFEESRQITGQVMEKYASMSFPSLSLDSQNNVYIMWELFPHRQGRPLGLGFAYSIDGGSTFLPPSIIPGTDAPALGSNGGLQGLLMRKLAVNAAGKIVIVNSTFKMNKSSHIWLIRGGIDMP